MSAWTTLERPRLDDGNHRRLIETEARNYARYADPEAGSLDDKFESENNALMAISTYR